MHQVSALPGWSERAERGGGVAKGGNGERAKEKRWWWWWWWRGQNATNDKSYSNPGEMDGSKGKKIEYNRQKRKLMRAERKRANSNRTRTMEEWRRDSKKEKRLLESSEFQVQQECLSSLICACTCVVGERVCFLTGVKSLPGFGAGAISFNHFQNLCILFQSSCT